jgi:hypothetical protein
MNLPLAAILRLLALASDIDECLDLVQLMNPYWSTLAQILRRDTDYNLHDVHMQLKETTVFLDQSGRGLVQNIDVPIDV